MEQDNLLKAIRIELSPGERPLFQHLAAIIAGLITSGKLPEGQKLPAYRMLGFKLNLSEGTVNRAYRELERQHLIESRIGDGSYVCGMKSRKRSSFSHAPLDAPASRNTPINLAQAQFFPAEDLLEWKQQMDLSGIDSDHLLDLLNYTDERGLDAHRKAGARWMRNLNLEISANDIVCTNGSQHGIYLTLAALMKSHDAIAVDEYTYPGVLAAARRMNIRVVGISHDADGLCPRDLTEKMKNNRITAVFTVPTMHYPLGYRMPNSRRDEISDICKENNAYVFENETQGILCGGAALQTFYERNPAQTVLISSMSEAMPGLRAGYLAIPPKMKDRFKSVMKDICWMATPVGHEIAKRSMETGFIDRCAGKIRHAIRRRKELVAPVLRGLEHSTAEFSAHYWISLPNGVDDITMTEMLNQKGVLVAPSSQFSIRTRQKRHFIRASVTANVSDENLVRGFAEIKNLSIM